MGFFCVFFFLYLIFIYFTAGSLFEAPPEGVNVGISVENISKIYYNKKVLDQLNLQFYENQITSLLGQNGAAKTTTM